MTFLVRIVCIQCQISVSRTLRFCKGLKGEDETGIFRGKCVREAQEEKMLNNASEPDTEPNNVDCHCTGRGSFATNEYLAVWAFMYAFTCTMFVKKKKRHKILLPPPLLFLFFWVSLYGQVRIHAVYGAGLNIGEILSVFLVLLSWFIDQGFLFLQDALW